MGVGTPIENLDSLHVQNCGRGQERQGPPQETGFFSVCHTLNFRCLTTETSKMNHQRALPYIITLIFPKFPKKKYSFWKSHYFLSILQPVETQPRARLSQL